MASRSSIPERFTSLVPTSCLKDVELLTKRAISAQSVVSQMSAVSSTKDFIDAKIESISADLAVGGKFKDYFKGAKKGKDFIDEEFNNATSELRSEINQKERELIILRRQRKMISDDIDEVLPRYSTVDGAYSSILIEKILSTSSRQKKKKRWDQRAHSKEVFPFYGAVRHIDYGYVEKYCHLLGWLPGKSIKWASLVPKSLESEGLAYLFGVRETVLSEPCNGLTLHHIIHEGFNNGWIVFVPNKPEEGEEIVWRCILVEQVYALKMICTGLNWRDIDGKALQFLTPNRPARRYLYLRFVITFLNQLKLGNVGWLDRVDAKDYLWEMPGPYLRDSMLRTLTRRISNHFLPEVFYESTFTTARGCPQRSPEEEEDLAMELDHKMDDVLAEKVRDEDEERSDSDSESD